MRAGWLVGQPHVWGPLPLVPHFLAPITRQGKWGGEEGQRGGVLGPPFLGFRAFTKQGLLKFSLSFV